MAGQEWKLVSGRRWKKKEGQANGMNYFYIENEKSAWKTQMNEVHLKG